MEGINANDQLDRGPLQGIGERALQELGGPGDDPGEENEEALRSMGGPSEGRRDNALGDQDVDSAAGSL